MRVPPMIMRRLLLAPLVLLAELAFLLLSPVLAVLALLAAPFGVGSRGLRAVAIAVSFAALHGAATLACLGLWVRSAFGLRARTERAEEAHYALLRWFVGAIHDAMVRCTRAEVVVTESAAAEELLSARRSPVVVLSRHAGEGDSLVVLDTLLRRHGRRPRLVLHDALRLDPLIDVLGHRLPNRFVDPRGGDTEVEIAAMAAGLPADAAVLIFPEGGNFSPARRARGIERLEEAGHEQQAAAARSMAHVVAPRPGGALAALDAAPDADVVLVGHVGVPVGARELWRQLPRHQRIELRLWAVPAEHVPRERDAQIEWLFGWWQTLDDWVASSSTAPPR